MLSIIYSLRVRPRYHTPDCEAREAPPSDRKVRVAGNRRWRLAVGPARKVTRVLPRMCSVFSTFVLSFCYPLLNVGTRRSCSGTTIGNRACSQRATRRWKPSNLPARPRCAVRLLAVFLRAIAPRTARAASPRGAPGTRTACRRRQPRPSCASSAFRAGSRSLPKPYHPVFHAAS